MQIRARVRGKVQGVYFRASTRTEALALGLIGYAVNNDDGSVTVVAEGSDAAIQQLLTWLASGPEHAEVVELNHSMSNENLTNCFLIGLICRRIASLYLQLFLLVYCLFNKLTRICFTSAGSNGLSHRALTPVC